MDKQSPSGEGRDFAAPRENQTEIERLLEEELKQIHAQQDQVADECKRLMSEEPESPRIDELLEEMKKLLKRQWGIEDRMFDLLEQR